MPLCPHITIMLITVYTLSNYYVNCDFRFREVLLGSQKSYLDVAKVYQVTIFKVLTVSDNTTWSGRLFLLVK